MNYIKNKLNELEIGYLFGVVTTLLLIIAFNK